MPERVLRNGRIIRSPTRSIRNRVGDFTIMLTRDPNYCGTSMGIFIFLCRDRWRTRTQRMAHFRT